MSEHFQEASDQLKGSIFFSVEQEVQMFLRYSHLNKNLTRLSFFFLKMSFKNIKVFHIISITSAFEHSEFL